MNDNHARTSLRSPLRLRTLRYLVVALAATLARTEPGIAQTPITGAQIDEGALTAVIYVSQRHPRASDERSGSRMVPKKTITAAIEQAYKNNVAGIGTRIIVNPGVYREALRLHPGARPTSAPLVIEAAEPGETIISGSDLFTEWTAVGDGIYTHPWPYDWGVSSNPWEGQPFAPVPSELTRRREMVFVDGVLMRQYLSYAEMLGTPGSFYVDEAADLLYVHAPGPEPLNTRQVEVSVRDVGFSANRQRRIILRGLIFEHVASTLPNGAVYIGNSTGVLIEDCAFRWNNWAGLKLENVVDLTVRRSTANYNGAMGMGGPRIKNFIFEDVETSYNNLWRGGEWGQFYAPWATAGSKWLNMHDGIFRRYTTNYNDVPGFWMDIDNQRVTIDSLTSCFNLHLGFYLEHNQGPITVRNSVICNNEYFGHNGTAGVRFTNTRDITFERNIVYGNARAQLFSPNRSAANRQRCVTDWETGVESCNTSGGWVLRHNVFVGTEPSEYLADVMYNTPPVQIIDNIASDENLWYHPAGPGMFLHFSKEPRTLDDWRARWSADANSIFAPPLFVDPENGNFNLLPGSPLSGWGLPTGLDTAPELVEYATEAETPAGAPRDLVLEGNYPNPFNPQTEIRYTLHASAHVRMEVYDALGRRVALLEDAWREPGHHQVSFDASHLGSGVYFVRLEAGPQQTVRPIHLIK